MEDAGCGARDCGFASLQRGPLAARPASSRQPQACPGTNPKPPWGLVARAHPPRADVALLHACAASRPSPSFRRRPRSALRRGMPSPLRSKSAARLATRALARIAMCFLAMSCPRKRAAWSNASLQIGTRVWSRVSAPTHAPWRKNVRVCIRTSRTRCPQKHRLRLCWTGHLCTPGMPIQSCLSKAS